MVRIDMIRGFGAEQGQKQGTGGVTGFFLEQEHGNL